MNAQVLGISVDHVPCLKAWADSLGGIHFPLLSDFWPHGVVSQSYGVLRTEGYSERAIFIIDKEGIIRYIDVHDIDNQPSNEILRQELRRLNPATSASPCRQPGAGEYQPAARRDCHVLHRLVPRLPPGARLAECPQPGFY